MRRFENQAHDEFWEVWIEDGRVLCHRFGRLGTRGLVGIERFPTDDDATRELERRMADRIASGFTEANLAWGAFPADDLASTEETIAPDDLADEWAIEDEPQQAHVAEAVVTIRAHAPPPALPPAPLVSAAVAAIGALCAASGGRSWWVAREARRARAALRQLGVVDPVDVPALSEALERALRLASGGGRRRLPVSGVRRAVSGLDPSVAARYLRALDGGGHHTGWTAEGR